MWSQAYTWAVSHWDALVTCFFTIAYIYANVMKRPNPAQLSGAKAAWWRFVDLICILGADKVPGKLKPLFVPSPAPAD